MKYLFYINLILFMLITIGCNKDSETLETKEFYINHYKSECYSFELALCMQSRISNNDEWSFFYDTIEGFEYEWGYTYKIKVSVENIENPPEDASSIKYTLLEVISKEKELTTTSFDISASRASNLLVKKSDNLYELYSDKEFTCVTEDCELIDTLITQDKAVLFEFYHQEEPSEPLLTTQIKCSSSRELFRESCL